MCFNEGIEDRFIRLVVGLGMLVVSIFILVSGYVTSITPVIVVIVGAVLFGTGALGLCPLYSILRLNTGCKRD